MDHQSALLLLAVFLLASVPLPAEDVVHIVEKGETIYSIARSFNIDPGDLMILNNITDASRLQAGKRLTIPVNPIGITANTGEQQTVYREYRVSRNETLYSIAQTNSTTVQTLREANGFSQSYVLKEGDMIRVPVSAGAVTKSSGAGSVTSAGLAGSLNGVRQTTVRDVDSALRWPVTPREIVYMDGKLPGVMVTGERAEAVRSLTQGTVISAGPYRGFGRVAIVQVAGGYLYVYGGCESLSVKEGDRISPGTEIGKLGIDAVSDKPQLFFLVFLKDNPIDPSKAPRA
ncbi:MAG: LysM peptidoglycan-binding domain-containing protein [Treponema sp.]|jgi:murein DD-endopeptidase MepM/ murein hydrolase activator NlpD|nr:LysM peptidoglycan-binding domain-containing protein [Treponema sp.]